MKIGSVAKSGVALAVAGGIMISVAAPAQAGGAFVAGVLGGTALGLVAGSAIAAAAAPPPPPPPPGYYAPYAPAYAGGPGPYGPGPRCWYEPQQVWDGYAYVVRRVRVCD